MVGGGEGNEWERARGAGRGKTCALLHATACRTRTAIGEEGRGKTCAPPQAGIFSPRVLAAGRGCRRVAARLAGDKTCA